MWRGFFFSYTVLEQLSHLPIMYIQFPCFVQPAENSSWNIICGVTYTLDYQLAISLILFCIEGRQLEWCGSREKEMKKKLSFKILNQNIRGIVGRAVCHAVSYWMFSFEVRVCFPGRLHGSCDGQIGVTTGHLTPQYFNFFFCQLPFHQQSIRIRYSGHEQWVQFHWT